MDDPQLWWCCLIPQMRVAFTAVWGYYIPFVDSYIPKSALLIIYGAFDWFEGEPFFLAALSMMCLEPGEIVIDEDTTEDVYFFTEDRGNAVWLFLGGLGGSCTVPCRLLTFPL